MTDELAARKPFRKRKKVQDISSKQDQENFSFFTRTFDADKTGDLGLWCGDCRKRVRWKELVTVYETQSNDFYRIWFCPRCDLMLRQDNITDLGLAQEAEEMEKTMDLSGQLARMNALEAGTEKLLGMSMAEYAKLQDEHPKQAKKVYKKAMKRAKKKQAKADLKI